MSPPEAEGGAAALGLGGMPELNSNSPPSNGQADALTSPACPLGVVMVLGVRYGANRALVGPKSAQIELHESPEADRCFTAPEAGRTGICSRITCLFSEGWHLFMCLVSPGELYRVAGQYLHG
ncbi:hypothetical protein EYF80_006711 [Liparis tanakae]|uniref:Uncharacterized protein n=1 Tax=Liparis tanakae TaxID=230148 RepID=A0A4Z2IZV0_9TELE|nr:hypothetical protein EYF80_006711 [Liparis tanakae]